MRVDRVQTFAVKIPYHDRFGGHTARPTRFPGSEYYFEEDWREVYADRTEALLVRVDTDQGLHGWGECQAPIVPEAAQAVIDRLLGPMLLGADPRDARALRDRMYQSMNVRGHFTGFMVDAISGLDIALWDIAAKAAGTPLAAAIGAPLRDRLPAYVSGLRAPTVEDRAALAAEYFRAGYAGVKLYLGHGLDPDVAQATAVRDRVGSGARLVADAFWVYSMEEAVRLGERLAALGVEWLESPIAPEDVLGHARLANQLDLPVAVGEALRTGHQFADWLRQDALDVAQPDIARCGITEGCRIAELVATYRRPVALHLGVSLGVAMAATWHVAATLPHFLIQEHHPPMLELTNRFVAPPLRLDRGSLIVPAGPGLGVDVDVAALAEYVSGRGEVNRVRA